MARLVFALLAARSVVGVSPSVLDWAEKSAETALGFTEHSAPAVQNSTADHASNFLDMKTAMKLSKERAAETPTTGDVLHEMPDGPIATDEEELQELIWDAKMQAIKTIGSFLAFLVLSVAGAYLYSVYMAGTVLDSTEAEQYKDKGFMYGPFSCMDDLEVSACACCCPGLVWADTMNTVSVLSYWRAFVVYLAVVVVVPWFESTLGFSSESLMVDAFVVQFVATIALFTYFRQQLREKLQMKTGAVELAKDFFSWCCCSCCAVAQEARHVKFARKQLEV